MYFQQGNQFNEALNTPVSKKSKSNINLKHAPVKSKVESCFPYEEDCVKQLNFDNWEIDQYNKGEFQEQFYGFQYMNNPPQTPMNLDKQKAIGITPSTNETLSTFQDSNLTSYSYYSEKNSNNKGDFRNWEDVSYKIDFQNNQNMEVENEEPMKVQRKYFE